MIFIGSLQWRQIFDLDAERTLEALHDCLQLIFRRGIDVLEGQFAELVAVAALATDAYPALVYFAPARHRVGALTLPGVVREVKAAGRGRQGWVEFRWLWNMLAVPVYPFFHTRDGCLFPRA
jgi:hypothetical protein